MGNRKIVGKLYTANDSPKVNASGTIQLVTNSFTPDNQYLISGVRYRTNAQGELFNPTTNELGISLWVNSEGIIPNRYKFFFPDGASFEFVLPEGNNPIELSTLRSQAPLDTPATPTLLDVITNQWAEMLTLLPTSLGFTPSMGGQSLQLSRVPPRPEQVGLYVNGLKAQFGVEFIVNGSLIQWQGQYSLSSNDIIEVIV